MVDGLSAETASFVGLLQICQARTGRWKYAVSGLRKSLGRLPPDRQTFFFCERPRDPGGCGPALPMNFLIIVFLRGQLLEIDCHKKGVFLTPSRGRPSPSLLP